MFMHSPPLKHNPFIHKRKTPGKRFSEGLIFLQKSKFNLPFANTEDRISIKQAVEEKFTIKNRALQRGRTVRVRQTIVCLETFVSFCTWKVSNHMSSKKFKMDFMEKATGYCSYQNHSAAAKGPDFEEVLPYDFLTIF